MFWVPNRTGWPDMENVLFKWGSSDELVFAPPCRSWSPWLLLHTECQIMLAHASSPADSARAIELAWQRYTLRGNNSAFVWKYSCQICDRLQHSVAIISFLCGSILVVCMASHVAHSAKLQISTAELLLCSNPSPTHEFCWIIWYQYTNMSGTNKRVLYKVCLAIILRILNAFVRWLSAPARATKVDTAHRPFEWHLTVTRHECISRIHPWESSPRAEYIWI